MKKFLLCATVLVGLLSITWGIAFAETPGPNFLENMGAPNPNISIGANKAAFRAACDDIVMDLNSTYGEMFREGIVAKCAPCDAISACFINIKTGFSFCPGTPFCCSGSNPEDYGCFGIPVIDPFNK